MNVPWSARPPIIYTDQQDATAPDGCPWSGC